MNSVDKNPARIIKIDKHFARKLEFKGMKFPVKIRDIHKIEKNVVSGLVFLLVRIKKNCQPKFKKKILLKDMSIYF